MFHWFTRFVTPYLPNFSQANILWTLLKHLFFGNVLTPALKEADLKNWVLPLQGIHCNGASQVPYFGELTLSINNVNTN